MRHTYIGRFLNVWTVLEAATRSTLRGWKVKRWTVQQDEAAEVVVRRERAGRSLFIYRPGMSSSGAASCFLLRVNGLNYWYLSARVGFGVACTHGLH